MNILFYVEPLIEKGLPYFKEGWATSWSRKIGYALEDNWNCYIGLSDALAEKFGEDKDFKVIIFKQSELLKPFETGSLEASSAWYNNSYTTAQMDYYIDLMKNKFLQIEFNVIISFTPVPFFRKLYPNAKIFHMEYSIFSRLPFPQTWHLDPVGIHKYSFLSKYKDKIKQIELSATARNYISRLQDTCINVFREKNIFENDIKILRRKYKFLVLLPIQFSQYYLFDCHTKYRNQFDYLIGVLEQVPADIGVIFTMHPEYPIFSKETISYVQSVYSNAIFLENSRYIYSASQYLMPCVDAVITVSSSLGLQTLLFKKKLLAIGAGDMDYIADAQNLNNMHDILNADDLDKNSILWFFITKYAISSTYLFDKKWLNNFLKKALELPVNEKFFCDIDKPDKIIEQYINEIIENSRWIPRWVNSIADNMPYLYVLYHATYSEEKKIVPVLFEHKNTYKARFDLRNVHTNDRLRFDPLENASCEIELAAIRTDGLNYRIVPYNAIKEKASLYTFITTDPIIEIIGDFSRASYIEIEYSMRILNAREVSNIACKKFVNYENKLANLANQINEKEQYIQDITATRGYKLLQKIRVFKGKISEFVR